MEIMLIVSQLIVFMIVWLTVLEGRNGSNT